MDENKSGLYIVAIVGVIAVVALVVLVLSASARTNFVPNSGVAEKDAAGQMIRVLADDDSVDSGYSGVREVSTPNEILTPLICVDHSVESIYTPGGYVAYRRPIDGVALYYDYCSSGEPKAPINHCRPGADCMVIKYHCTSTAMWSSINYGLYAWRTIESASVTIPCPYGCEHGACLNYKSITETTTTTTDPNVMVAE